MSVSFTNIRGGVLIVADFASLPSGLPIGTLAVTADTGDIYTYDGSIWNLKGAAAGGGISSLNGQVGGTQSFAIGSASLAPLFISAGNIHTLNIPMANTASVTAGLLSKTEYDTFNAKQSALTFGSISTSTTGVTVVNGANSTVGPAVTININTASTSLTGLLSSVDWNTFNNKQDLLGYTPVNKAGDTMSGNLTMTNNTELRLRELTANGTNEVRLKAPSSLSADYTLTLPVDDGNPGEYLITDGSGNLSWIPLGGTISHSSLLNLSADDHLQYALLLGRSGGQSLIGGIDASNNLTLRSTSNATKGKIILGAAANSAYDEVNERLGIGISSPTVAGDFIGAVRVAGTAGAGYLNIIKQSSAPSTPADGFRLFADSLGRFAWKGENGFVRTFDGTSNTANRSYILPNFNGQILTNTNILLNELAVSSNIVIAETDEHSIYKINTSASRTITLPNPTLVPNRVYVFKDSTGTCDTFPITIARFGSETIEGLAANKTFETPFGSWMIYSDGTNWWLI